MDTLITKGSHNWSKLAKSCKVVPSDRNNPADSSEVYFFRAVSLENVPVPKFLLDTSKAPDHQVQVHLSTTLFDTKGKEKEGSFIGNTWTGQRLLFSQCCKPKTESKPVKWNGREAILSTFDFGLDYGFVFHTKIKPEELRLIVEIVLTVCDKDGAVRLDEFGICWCPLPLKNKDETATFDCKDLEKHLIVDFLYSGTPRLLLFAGSSPAQLKKAKIEGAQVKHFTAKLQQLRDIALHLMVENELCGGGDPALGVIPGLESKPVVNNGVELSQGLVFMNSDGFRLAEQFTIVLEKTTFRVVPDLDTQLKNYISENTGQAKQVTAISLRAEIGVHNGRRFVGKTLEEKLVGKSVQVLELSRVDSTTWKADRVTLNACMSSPLIAIVILLHAKVTIDQEDSQICLGWISLLPWDKSGAVITGNYQARLRLEAPMIAVSNCLVFKDVKGVQPEITTTLRSQEPSRKTIDINDVLAREAEKKLVQSRKSADKIADGTGSSSDVESVEEEITEQVQPPSYRIGNTEEEAPSSDSVRAPDIDAEGRLQSFNLICTTKQIGASSTRRELLKLNIEITFEDMMKRLELEFGNKVYFSYQVPGRAPIPVKSEDDLDEFFDYLDSDFEGAKHFNGTVPVDVLLMYPSDVDAGKSAVGADVSKAPGAADVVHQVPSGGQDASRPLQEIVLECDLSELGKDEPREVKIPTVWTWNQARQELEKLFGFSVTLSFEDIDGNPVRVDGETGWKALVQDVLEDWEGDRELDGGMNVTIHRPPAPAPASSIGSAGGIAPSRAPSTGPPNAAHIVQTAGAPSNPPHLPQDSTVAAKEPSKPITVPADHPQPAPSSADRIPAPSPVVGQDRTPAVPSTANQSDLPSKSKPADFVTDAKNVAPATVPAADLPPASNDKGSTAHASGGGSKVPKSEHSEYSSRDESDHVRDENSPPANRARNAPGTPKAGGLAGRSSTASRVGRNLLSTDGSDVEEGRRKDKGGHGTFEPGAKPRRGRHYHVEEAGDVAERDVDMHIVPGRPEPPTSMSRALKARLFTTGISSLVPNYRHEVPFVEAGSSHLGSIDINHETGGYEDIVVQILAVRLPAVHARVFFTLQFYHFATVESSVAVLERISAQDLPGEEEGRCPAVLRVLEGPQAAPDVTGIVIHFTVDSSAGESGKPGVPHTFFRYLASKTLCVDMWDADSMLPIGTAQVDLRSLLRQGKDAVQTGGEFALSDPVDFSVFQDQRESSGSSARAILPRAMAPTSPSTVFIRLVNVCNQAPHAQDVASTQAGGSMQHGSPSKGIGSRVLPLTDTDPSVYPSSRESVSKSMALLFAESDDVLRHLGGNQGVVPADRLQEAIIRARLDLSVREVTALTLHLTSGDVGRGVADIGRLRVGGTEDIERSGGDKTRIFTCVKAIVAAIVKKYNGDIRKAFDRLSTNGMMTASHLGQLVREAQELRNFDCGTETFDSLMRILAGAQGGGITAQHFVQFFTVQYAAEACTTSGSAPVDKKMARWQRVRAARKQVKGGRMEGVGEDEKFLLIEAAKKMRELHKETKIKEFLENSITTRETIFPSFGETCYLPYVLRSPFSEERVISINIDDPLHPQDSQLQLVTKADEWRELERNAGRGLGAPEDDMFARDGHGHTVWVQAHQQVTVPFKFRVMSPGLVCKDTETVGGNCKLAASLDDTATTPNRSRIITVTFAVKTAGGGQGPPLYVLQVEVLPRPFVVDHLFRMYHGQNDFLKRKILLDTANDVGAGGWRGGPQRAGASFQRNLKHLWCSSGSVVVGSSASSADSEVQEVHLKYRCGQAGTEETFYVLLYNDAYYASLYEIWQVKVAALHRLDIQGLVGQTEPGVVMLRSRDGPRTVRGYASHPVDLTLPDKPRQIDAALSEFPFQYHPLAPGRRDIIVHFMEAPPVGVVSTTSALRLGVLRPVSAWLLAARAKMPLISKRYDIRLPLGKVSNKKILYTNPYSVARVFKLKTDQPRLLNFKEASSTITIPPFGQQYIGLRFTGVSHRCTCDVLVFINDDEDKTEECLAVTATYL